MSEEEYIEYVQKGIDEDQWAEPRPLKRLLEFIYTLRSRIARLEAMRVAGDELFYAILRYWDSHSPENRERVSTAISGYECALSELEGEESHE